MSLARVLLVAVGLTAGIAFSARAEGPAFDCAKAEHEIELLICKDPALAAQDRELATVYAEAVEKLRTVADSRPAIAELKAVQRGWVKGRDDCWKADDQKACAADLYARRIAELQARYMLVKGGDPVFYTCRGNPADEIVATFVPTTPATVRLERGDTVTIGWQEPAASGARYVADFAVSFWIKGDEAQVEWPEGEKFTCTVRKG